MQRPSSSTTGSHRSGHARTRRSIRRAPADRYRWSVSIAYAFALDYDPAGSDQHLTQLGSSLGYGKESTPDAQDYVRVTLHCASRVRLAGQTEGGPAWDFLR